eukprot:2091319-Prymnesium_polylepis.1
MAQEIVSSAGGKVDLSVLCSKLYHSLPVIKGRLVGQALPWFLANGFQHVMEGGQAHIMRQLPREPPMPREQTLSPPPQSVPRLSNAKDDTAEAFAVDLVRRKGRLSVTQLMPLVYQNRYWKAQIHGQGGAMEWLAGLRKVL